jgi:hypothetical protein
VGSILVVEDGGEDGDADNTSRARVLTLMVPAVPRRKDGIESVSATTKISISDLV